MPNVKAKISNHNFQVKRAEEEPNVNYGCNCTQVIGPCPLGGNCFVNSVVYGAEVTDSQAKKETYTGLTSNTLKKDITDIGTASKIEIQSIQQLYLAIYGI